MPLKSIKQSIRCFADDVRDYVNLSRNSKGSNAHSPILISGAPRSGTTWLGELLNSNSVRVFHEPFQDKNVLWNWHLDPNIHPLADFDAIDKIFDSIAKGKYWHGYKKYDSGIPMLGKFSPHNFLPRIQAQAIIKDPTTCFFLDELASRYTLQIILLYRDPLSIVSSLKRLNWDPTHRLNLIFTLPYFSKYDVLQEVIEKFDLDEIGMIEKMALQTALLHNFMNDFQSRHEHLKLSYEELVLEPMLLKTQFFEKFNCEFNDETRQNIINLTQSKHESYQTHDVERYSKDFIEPWKNNLSEAEIKIVVDTYESINGEYQKPPK